jgi:hypothetical protein
MADWNELSKAGKREVISEEEFSIRKERILEVMDVFYNELEMLSAFSLNFSTDSWRFRLPIEDTFSMVLTPVDSNSLAASLALEGNPFGKTKRELKLRTNKKNQTERVS